MTRSAPRDSGYRFPPEIISHAVWLDYRLGLSFRDVEDLLAERGSPSRTRRSGHGVRPSGPTTPGRCTTAGARFGERRETQSPTARSPAVSALIFLSDPPRPTLSVSNSSSGRRWKLDHAPAVGDPTHMVEFGTGRRAFAREA